MEILVFMPAGAIKDHNDTITRVTVGNLIDENLYAIAVDRGNTRLLKAPLRELTAP
ncbi:hypothetical protein [Nitrosomonas sp. Is37]|uniref:hypothetical protein n=1 Tax=Nitrosomonas sp. Is37 TaxID=3080535 RepID=UPI00294AF4D8|nr:hypothetical protein [Nitrosomonas sp. Is37]MDV6343642.1 hypothetical protein [Nitrosomonas sp. Is37]